MADNRRYLQNQFKTLAGSGASLGAVSVTLNSLTDIDGNLVTMATYFGTKGYATIEPGSRAQEESISFTGITQNANGTATLTGVSNVGFFYPYTETPNLSKSHPGGVKLIFTNTAGFYDTFANKFNDERIQDGSLWTFPSTTANNRPQLSADIDALLNEELITFGQLARASFAGTVDASTVQKGIVEISTQAEYDARTGTGATGAILTIDPTINRTVLASDYVVTGGVANTYTATLVPAITSYRTGQIVTVQISATNTGASTINVNGLGAQTILKNINQALIAGDLTINEVVTMVYDGTNFQLVGKSNTQTIATAGANYTVNADETVLDWHTVEIHPMYTTAEDHVTALRNPTWVPSGASGWGLRGPNSYTLVQTGIGAYAEMDTLENGSNNTALSWDQLPTVRLKWSEWVNATAGTFGSGNYRTWFAGFTQATAAAGGGFGYTGNVTDQRIGFASYNGDLYSITCDGAAITAKNLGVHTSVRRQFAFVWTGSTTVDFYIDGTLVSTHVTAENIPTNNTSLYLWKQYTTTTGTGATLSSTPYVFSQKIS